MKTTALKASACVLMNEIYERFEKDPAFSVVQSKRGKERQHGEC